MKDYLSIGEISKLFHLNKQTLQYYDKEHIFSPEYRDPDSRYRLYRFNQVYSLALICYLRKVGFSIAQIKDYLNIHNSQEAIAQLKAQSQVLKEQYQQVLSMDNVLQRKLHFMQQRLNTMELGKAELRFYEKRKYIALGEETTLYCNEVFYFYPTIAFVELDPDTQNTHISFGAYLEPDTMISEKYIDTVGNIAAQTFLCACFKGSYADIVAQSNDLRRQYAHLNLASYSIHFNISDQFVETDKNAYISDVQIPVLSDE